MCPFGEKEKKKKCNLCEGDKIYIKNNKRCCCLSGRCLTPGWVVFLKLEVKEKAINLLAFFFSQVLIVSEHLGSVKVARC